MKKILTAVLAVTVLAAMVILAGPGMAQFDPGKQLGPKGKVTGPPLSPALQSAKDADNKERLEAQLKANAARQKAEKERAEALKKAQGVGKVQPTAPAKK
jgi:hypothetical protein